MSSWRRESRDNSDMVKRNTPEEWKRIYAVLAPAKVKEPRIWNQKRDIPKVAAYLRAHGAKTVKELRENPSSPVYGIGSTLVFMLKDRRFCSRKISKQWRTHEYYVCDDSDVH